MEGFEKVRPVQPVSFDQSQSSISTADQSQPSNLQGSQSETTSFSSWPIRSQESLEMSLSLSCINTFYWTVLNRRQMWSLLCYFSTWMHSLSFLFILGKNEWSVASHARKKTFFKCPIIGWVFVAICWVIHLDWKVTNCNLRLNRNSFCLCDSLARREFLEMVT